MCPINPCLYGSGEGSRKALAKQRDGTFYSSPRLWQENIAEADLSGAPFESWAGDCFWTVRISVAFSRFAGFSWCSADSQWWPFPSPGNTAFILSKHRPGFPALSSPFPEPEWRKRSEEFGGRALSCSWEGGITQGACLVAELCQIRR